VLKNLNDMPGIVKWLTAVGLVPVVFLVATLIPDGSVQVFGRAMANAEWWSTGAGIVVAILAFTSTAAAVLMLNRSRFARPIYLLNLLAAYVSGPIIARLTKSNAENPFWSLVAGLATVAAIALYFYKSKATGKYFRSPSK
jgi:uncharacterized membrane protein